MTTLNLDTCSSKEIVHAIDEKIKQMHHMIGDELYPEIMKSIRLYKCPESSKHMKVKHYQAIDRINMYIAYEVLNIPVHLYSLSANMEMKKLKKIYNALMDTDYNHIRDVWHNNGLKDLFYKQKEARKISEYIDNKCVIARCEIGEEQGFVSINDGKLTIVKKICDATEFVATGRTNDTLLRIHNLIFEKFMCESRPFFNDKMTGRTVFEH